ncbi:hypothetical protein CF326_g5410 [Tilletia indica]|nr:hypothetical protein CF326_g5410 [Tilletia indica]
MSSQSSVPPSTPVGHGHEVGSESFIDGYGDDFIPFHGRSHSPSLSVASQNSMTAGSSHGGHGDLSRPSYAPHFQGHAQAQAQMQAQMQMFQAQMQAQMHGLRPDIGGSPGFRPGMGHGHNMAPPPSPLGTLVPSPQVQHYQPQQTTFGGPENVSPSFVPTGPVGGSSTASKRRAVQNPTDKTLAKRFLNEVEVSARMEALVKKWVNASISAVLDDLTTTVHNRVDIVLEKYSLVVESFQAQVVRVDGSEDLRRSDDGNVYLRLNHASLDKYLSTLESTKRSLEKDIAGLTNQMAAMKVKIETMAVVTVSQGLSVGTAPSSSTSALDPSLKEHKWTLVQAAFRVIVHQLAGIPAHDQRTKIYDFTFPSSPDQIPYHPVAYIPTEGEVAAPESSAAEGGRRYRQLRLRLDLSYSEFPNNGLLKPILDALVRDWKKYGIPSTITAERLMSQILSRTWTHWKNRYIQLNAPGATAKAVKKGWAEQAKKVRRKKRPTIKATRRCSTLRRKLKKVPGWEAFDMSQNIAFNDAVQSDDETEGEDGSDESDGDDDLGEASKSSSVKTLVRKIPAFRSSELTDFLRSLDDDPKFRIVESAELVPRPPPPGSRRWMIRADYVSSHIGVDGSILPNLGPFEGVHSVAMSADMYGSAPVPARLPSSFDRASGSGSRALLPSAGSALARLFGSDMTSGEMAMVNRGELDGEDDSVDGEDGGMMSLADILG